jgi:hypothetical protein
LKTLNKDGVIDDNDQQILAKATPDIFGGWTNDFRYKNWEYLSSVSI